MVIYRNAGILVQLELDIQAIRYTWKGNPTSEEYKNAHTRSLKMAERYKVNKWIIDQRSLKKFQYEDILWTVQEWVPKAIASLGRGAQIAVILSPTNQFSKLGADISRKAILEIDQACRSQYFTSLSEAKTWIISHTQENFTGNTLFVFTL